ncbi:MAG: ComEC/Rec2 family competence protein [Acetobacteraceae bacterium]|nr:ComEC/Rec2 family competence protein [Acetobacteraceae bacterium]
MVMSALYAAARLHFNARASGAAELAVGWARAERGRFGLWLPVAMGAGVILALAARHDPAPWLGAALFGLGVALAVLARPLRPPAALLAALGLGIAAAQFATWRAAPLLDLPRHAVVVTGRATLVETLPQGQRVTVGTPSLDGGPALPRSLRIRLRRNDATAVEPGATVRLRAMLTPPAPPAYPGAWDLQRDAFFDGLGGYGFALGGVEVLAPAAPSGFAVRVAALRAGVAARIGAVLGGDEGAIATTLLTGFTSAIPDADKAAFRDSGLAHLLAIAGLHIGIVMGWAMFAVRAGLAAWPSVALRWPTKQIAVIAALAAGGFYMVLTGAHVPIIRSFAMACLLGLAVLAGRRALSLRGLALAAVAIMLWAPNEVLGVSFQMSFSAVLALIAGYEMLRGPLARLRGRGHGARGLLMHLLAVAITSAIAGTFSAPFAAYHFGRVQIYYVLANLLAVPLTAFWVMPAGMLALLLMPLHLEAIALLPMGWGIAAILWIGRQVSALPEAVFATEAPPPWGMLVLGLGIAWLGIWRTGLRWLGLLPIAIGIVSVAWVRPPDILVSADARLIAAHTPAGVWEFARSGASRFTRDAWLQHWAVARDQTLPEDGKVGPISCLPDACILHSANNGPIATILRGPAAREDCDSDVLVSSEPIRLRCSEWIPWVDRFSVWRDGAQAIWLTHQGPVIVSDREVRGDRPWVPPPPQPRAR